MAELDVAEQHRVAGPDGGSGHRHAPDLGEHRGGVIAAAAAGAGDDEHDVGLKRGPPDLGGERVGVVRLNPADHGKTACRARAASMTELLSTISPGRSTEPAGLISSPVGMIATTGCRVTESTACPAAAAAARSAGRSRRPAGTSSWPSWKSSPVLRTLCPRDTGPAPPPR